LSRAPMKLPRDGSGCCRNQGMERRYANEIIGYNLRMSDIHAAIGRVQLRRLPGWTAKRRSNSAYLTGALADLEQRSPLSLPVVGPLPDLCGTSTRAVSRRDQLVTTLAGLGVETGVYYPTPIHRLPAYDSSSTFRKRRPHQTRCCRFRFHPALSDNDLDGSSQRLPGGGK